MSEGLSQASVMSIYQDQLGRMWFGTREGISVYNGETMRVYKAWNNEDSQKHTDVLYGNECDFLSGNKEGDIFFRTNWALMRYDIRDESFHIIRSQNVRTLTSFKGDIWCICGDSLFTYNAAGDSLDFRLKTDVADTFTILPTENKLWLGTLRGLYLIEEGKSAEVIIPSLDIYSVFESSAGDIWVGTRMNGLFRISPDGTQKRFAAIDRSAYTISDDQIRQFTEDTHGNIWFGTFNGLHKYNPYTGQFSVFTHDRLPGSLTHSSVFPVFMDKQGTMWVGTYYGGVNYFNPESDMFSLYTDNPTRNDCLSYGFVGRMVEDKDGHVWISTEGGGVNCLNRKTGTFRRYRADSGANSLLHDNVKGICYDGKRHTIYVGTHTGGFSRIDIKTGEIHNYLNDTRNNPDQSPSRIISSIGIHGDYLYVSARNGLFKMHLETETFERIGNYCIAFTFDSKGYMWIVYEEHIVRMNTTDTEDVEFYYYSDHNIRFKATCIMASRGNIYFGTLGSGLFCLNDSGAVTPYTVSSDHLLSNYCYDIAKTSQGNILVTSDKGLTILNPATGETRFIKLGISLPITSITEGCGVLVCKNNEIFVGSTDGLASFHEDDLDREEKEYQIYFSDILIHNEKVYPGDKTNILDKALPYTSDITLKHSQNNLIIRFASNNYIDVQKNNEYEYMLAGFDSEWIPTSMNSIYYTNLNPGNYELLLRERDLPLSSTKRQGISLNIKIKRPWYNTLWAWLLYLSITSTVLFFFVRMLIIRRNLSLSLQREREEKLRSEELNQEKLRFFTNISHEFRTPLTLIISQIELLFQNSTLSPSVYNKMIKISKHAKRMRNLISELLEFRRFEQNFATLRVTEQDLIPFLKDIYLSFSEMSIQQSITLRFTPSVESVLLWFDSYQMQKVFYNLLSNALKYTQKRGTVDITVEEDADTVTVKVIDSGIGMSAEDVNRIFDRFYQAENGMSASALNPGTGIGLALSLNIIELHHGRILVQSELNYGTIFSVKLLKGCEHFKEDKRITILKEGQEKSVYERNMHTEPLTEKEYEELSKIVPENADGEQFKVLLVEDNEELLQILLNLFSPLYKVSAARNGEEGLQSALTERPDLIVSDVMMPVMSGTEMCIRIKNNVDLCHIPVVLLTALNTVEQNIEGLQQGADDYIEKPFHAKALLMRCNNLIRNRLLMQRKWSKQGELDLNLLATNPTDQKLLGKITDIVTQHINNPDFDVNTLAKEVAMGRSSLFAKFKSLTGMTPNDFIQGQRLKRASIMLRENPQMQIVEISESLGFSSPVYFSRCFKSQFGVSPAHFRKEDTASE